MSTRPPHFRIARRPRSARADGFTLTEMLIAVAIIAVLIGIVGVVISRANRTADRFRLGAQLQALATGLEAYKADFAGYPTTGLDNGGPGIEINRVGVRGARVLCKALLAPGPRGTIASPFADAAHQDGSDGLGFRVLPRSGAFQQQGGDYVGKVYGPYLSESQFRYAKTTIDTSTTPSTVVIDDSKDYTLTAPVGADTSVILDANGNPILYYPLLNGQANLALSGNYVAPPDTDGDAATAVTDAMLSPTSTPMYRSTDNLLWIDGLTFQMLLGDVTGWDGTGTRPAIPPAPDGKIVAAADEQPAVRGKYILWSSGPDGLFGPRTEDGKKPTAAAEILSAMKTRYDDVTSFQE